ncbi:unnamed protein product [Ectocarpus sp. 12 AP-2014]
MVLIVPGVVWTGIMVTKFGISKVLVWKALERCIRPDENRELETGGDEEAGDDGQDVPELGQAVHNDEQEEQQPLVGATNRTLGILTRILSRVLNTGSTMPRTLRMIYRLWCSRRWRQCEGRAPTLQSQSFTGYNSLDPWDSGGKGGEVTGYFVALYAYYV